MSMSGADPVRAAGGTGVDVALFHVATRSADRLADHRLVLRRTVFRNRPDGGEVSVEQLWVTNSVHHERLVASLLRRLDRVATELIEGRLVPEVPGMVKVTPASLVALESAVAGRTTVELLALVRARLGTVPRPPTAPDVELSCAFGYLGQVARVLMVAALAALKLVEADQDDGGDDADVELDVVAADEELSTVDITRAALDRDLRDARTRFEAERRWDEVADCLASAVPTAPDGFEGDGPHWFGWECPGPDGGTWPAEDLEHHTVVLIGVDGAAVGEGNRQYNVFRYRLEPTVDIAAVLEDPAVQDALAEFAASRGDPAARAAAIAAIRSCRTGARSDWTRCEQRIDPLPRDPDAEIEMLGGTVLITDCRGVQVGNRMRQYNTFTSVLAPTIDLADLLCRDRQLIEMIVDYACEGGATYRTLQNELASAVCGEAGRALPGRPDGRVVTAPVRVAFQDGVMVGERVHQIDTREFAAWLPSGVRDALDRARAEAEEAANVLVLTGIRPGQYWIDVNADEPVLGPSEEPEPGRDEPYDELSLD
jgi:hypothetical protein